MTTVEKKGSIPPKSKEEIEIEEKRAAEALEAACADVDSAACALDSSAKKLKRTISDSKMKAVRFPTPSQLELEAAKPAPK